MEEQKQIFASPIRKYLAQKLQLSFDFAEGENIFTFETAGARYEVRVTECYLIKEEVGKEGQKLDKSRPLKVVFQDKSKPQRLKPDLYFSSSWFEVHQINDNTLSDSIDNECVYQGNGLQIADFLLNLDRERNHFSYYKVNWFSEPDPFDGVAYKSRPLNADEKKYLDNIIKDRL